MIFRSGDFFSEHSHSYIYHHYYDRKNNCDDQCLILLRKKKKIYKDVYEVVLYIFL